ncbi:Serologically defined colon cancer antigen 1, partial [Aphelenchoides avenae]
MSWDEIGAWLEQATQKGIAAAKAIVKLDLESNAITMRLANPYDEDDHVLNVDIDIALSAAQNSRKFFGDKRNAAEKQQRTQLATKKALKSAQHVAKSKVDQVRTRTNLARTRKTMWFEKFNWFVSSDGYLVIGGRDFQQNELLVKRYLRPGDLYVHADIHGSASVVIRNKSAQQHVPPRTLNEAGTMAVCYSSAWEAKIVVSAWWVRHDQVSRTAPTGEYLPAGSFMIRGKKNFLPSCQLQLGFGLLFKLDDESAARHRAMSVKSGEASEVGDSVVPDGNDAALEAVDEEEEQQLSEGSDEEQEEKEGDEEDEFPDVE